MACPKLLLALALLAAVCHIVTVNASFPPFNRGQQQQQQQQQQQPSTSGGSQGQARAANPANAPGACVAGNWAPANGSSWSFLYVWSGLDPKADGSPGGKDFVGVLDVTKGSPCFGKVVGEAEVPTEGNEPHHVGLNAAGTVLGVGGFNSWRRNQPSLYFFDVASDPRSPKFIKSVDTPLGAVADDLVRLSNGGFLVSLMGARKDGGTPGRVAELDAGLNLVAEHPRSGRGTDKFNPHGLAVAPGAGRFLTLDYVDYASTFKPFSKPTYRTTARIWDLPSREVVQVVDLGDASGLMTARLFNGTSVAVVTAGRGTLYALDLKDGSYRPIYKAYTGEGHCVLTAPFKSNTRAILSLYQQDEVQLLDVSAVPSGGSAKLLQSIKLPTGTGPHATLLSGSERLLAISTYYVQHGSGAPGSVSPAGAVAPFTNVNAKSVILFSVAPDGNSFEQTAVVPYKSLFPHRGVARPHGMAFKAVPASALPASSSSNGGGASGGGNKQQG